MQTRVLVKNALKSGRLRRQPCEVCGGKIAHAHHENYLEPYKVNWLCPQHHMELHSEKRKEEITRQPRRLTELREERSRILESGNKHLLAILDREINERSLS